MSEKISLDSSAGISINKEGRIVNFGELSKK